MRASVLIGGRAGFRDAPRDRRGLENRIAAPDRGARAHGSRRGPGRGPRAGRSGGRAGEVARVGHSRQPRRLAHGDREAPGHRSAPAARAAGTQARRARPGDRGPARHGRRRARRRDRRRRGRRSVASDLRGLPPGALGRGARRADAAPAGRPDDAGDRARLPRSGAHDRPANRPRQADARGRAHPVRGAARVRSRGARGFGPGSDLSDLQRGVCRDGRRGPDAAGALRGRASTRPHPGGARSERGRGPRSRGPDGDPGFARERAHRALGSAGAVAGPGPRALGPRAHPPRARGSRTRRGAQPQTRSVRSPGRDRGLPRSGAYSRRNRLVAHRRALRGAFPRGSVPGRGAQSRGRRGNGVRTGRGSRARRRTALGTVAGVVSPAPRRARRLPREARASRKPAPSSSAPPR